MRPTPSTEPVEGHDGQQHDYIPDFIIRLDNGVHLILETKGYDPLDEVKARRHTAGWTQ